MSISAHYDNENIFAKILRGDMPCAVITQDDNTLAIMDAFPQSRGHVLVIPKAPSRNLLEMHAKDIGRTFGMVQRISKAVAVALEPDGIVVSQFNGAPAGQTVFHTHVHIIPRYENTKLGAHAGGGMAEMGELKALAAKIRAAL